MYEQTRKEFLRENGVLNGCAIRRTDMNCKLYTKTKNGKTKNGKMKKGKTKKDDRLAAGYTMEQRAYPRAFLDAARKADQKWEIGKPVPFGALDGIQSVEGVFYESACKRVSFRAKL
ncbi:DUF3879 family protein [uncultured Acetatifactor sp.]|uniref:DUF3879 family protein n=1 Tax=uncultured Acetatifactor sp. TaxID=1671927 RepID=UPI00262ABF05|nr:DUF3879 family protein [uncultured Acetatifactor sp.]